MNEAAQALRHAPASLALVPTGSGNGLARHLGLPGQARAALELAASPRPVFGHRHRLRQRDAVLQRDGPRARRGCQPAVQPGQAPRAAVYLWTALVAFFHRRNESLVVTGRRRPGDARGRPRRRGQLRPVRQRGPDRPRSKGRRWAPRPRRGRADFADRGQPGSPRGSFWATSTAAATSGGCGRRASGSNVPPRGRSTPTARSTPLPRSLRSSSTRAVCGSSLA